MLTRVATDRVSKNTLTKGRRGLTRSFSHQSSPTPLSIRLVFRRQEAGQGLRETFQMIHDLESSRNLIQLFPNMGRGLEEGQQLNSVFLSAHLG